MENIFYLLKNGNFEYFVFNKPKDYSEKVISIKDVQNIARLSFKNAKSVSFVEISPTIQRIEESAFEKCEDLKSVIFGKLEESNDIKSIFAGTDGNLTIQYNAFKDCEKLETVIFPSVSSEMTIEKNAFVNCKNLRTVVFAYSYNVKIDETAFIGCRDLTFICSFGSSAERFAREHGFRIINY